MVKSDPENQKLKFMKRPFICHIRKWTLGEKNDRGLTSFERKGLHLKKYLKNIWIIRKPNNRAFPSKNKQRPDRALYDIINGF